MDAFGVLTFATAVLIGNLATLSLIKGYQRMKRENRFEWVTAFYYLSPLALIIGVLSLTR